MNTILLTICIAFVLTIIALLAMAIGWFLKGSSKILCGRCGQIPDPDKPGKKSCTLCKNEKENDTECGDLKKNGKSFM